MTTAEVAISDGAESILLLLCHEVDDVPIFDRTQFLSINLPFLMFRASGK